MVRLWASVLAARQNARRPMVSGILPDQRSLDGRVTLRWSAGLLSGILPDNTGVREAASPREWEDLVALRVPAGCPRLWWSQGCCSRGRKNRELVPQPV